MEMEDKFSRTEMLIGNDGLKKLSESKKFLSQKPEVYGKAFALLHFPDIYYRLRG